MAFANRVDAGRDLAAGLEHLKGDDVVVLGLPRGGVPVASEVARLLGATFDVIVVRKLGVRLQPELAMGAIGEGGVCIVNDRVVRMARIDHAQLVAVEQRERLELERRASRFRMHRPRTPLVERIAIVVDDGVATGSTARAACEVARAQGARRVVLAVPVAPRATLDELAAVADEVICLEAPVSFFAVGQFYRDFPQMSDEEVVALLDRAATTIEVTPRRAPP